MGDLAIDQEAEPVGMGQAGTLAGGFESAKASAMPASPSWAS
jgi:hypothetical protein